MSRPRPVSWLDLALVLLAALLVGSALAPDGPAWGGRDWDQFETDLLSARRSLLEEGELPLWMPYRVGGHDAWADPQSLWCSPLGLLVVLCGLRWGVCLAFALGAAVGVAGLQRLGRELGLGAAGRNLPGVALILSSPLALYAAGGIPTFVAGLALLPWLTLAVLRPEPRWALAGGALLALDLYAGDVNHFLYHALFLALLGGALALATRSPRPLRQVALLAVAAFVCAAPKLVPTALLARDLPRAVDSASRGALTPGLAARALLDRDAAPRLVARPYAEFVALTRDGRLANRERPAAPEELLPGTAVDWVNVGHYLGYATLGLALLGAVWLAGWGDPRRRRQLGALAAAAAALGWLACGSNPPLSAWDALHRLPVFGSTRSPAKLLLYPAFVLVLLGGVGLDRLARRLRETPRVSPGARRALLGLALGLVLLDVHPPARATYRAAYCEPPRPCARAARASASSSCPRPRARATTVRRCAAASRSTSARSTATPRSRSRSARCRWATPTTGAELQVLTEGAGRVRRWRFTAQDRGHPHPRWGPHRGDQPQRGPGLGRRRAAGRALCAAPRRAAGGRTPGEGRGAGAALHAPGAVAGAGAPAPGRAAAGVAGATRASRGVPGVAWGAGPDPTERNRMAWSSPALDAPLREQALVTGTVQGVGFRPAVFRLAVRLGLAGWVQNAPAGAELELEGPASALDAFFAELPRALPAGAQVEACLREPRPTNGERGFRIAASAGRAGATAPLQADVATCEPCLAEARDPTSRRYRYPFVACADCGPRFSIARGLPWDRARTSLAGFPLCAACAAEYADPGDRRFHAQATGCPACGPRLRLERAGRTLEGEAALRGAAEVLRGGGLLALKGLGGYQLLVDAQAPAALRRLRALKARPHKPLALMVADLAAARALARVDAVEAQLLQSPAAPIVLLTPRAGAALDEVASGAPALGLMLPTTALHALLLDEVGRPLAVSSGNRGGAPILTDDARARAVLGPEVDALLLHERAIVNFVDDSLAQVVGGAPQLLRRARGYVPRPLRVSGALPLALATGGQQKATLALAQGHEVELSQHVGDLDDLEVWEAWERVRGALLARRGAAPEARVGDLNPAYRSASGATLRVQHHEAHVLATVAEHGLRLPALGVAWDGAGLGHDGTVWGGEFFQVTPRALTRVAHLACFRLPGGNDAAAREPRRSALGLLRAAGLDAPPGWLAASFAPAELATLDGMLARDLRSPRTSSAGRLFDGVAALLGLGARVSFEGQAAWALEAL
ncbi:MAG: carbamoyltransferase HypF, partial [Planctomycetota bacterium]